MSRRKIAKVDTDTVDGGQPVNRTGTETTVKPDTVDTDSGIGIPCHALAPSAAAPMSAPLRAPPPTIESIVRARALQLALGALETLDEISRDTEAPASARVSAANSLLDRGIGKAIQQVSTEIRVQPSSGFLSALKEVNGARGKVIDHEAP